MRQIFVLVAATLVVSACGGGGDQSPPAGGVGGVPTTAAAPSTTTTAAPATTTSGVIVAADRAKAQALLLKASDFPSGWRATPYSPDPGEKSLRDEFSACMGIPSTDTRATAEVHSPEFRMAAAVARSTTTIWRSVEDFKAGMAAVAAPKYLPCAKDFVTKSLRRRLPAGVSLRSVAIKPLQVAAYREFSKAFGEFSMAFTVTAKFMAQGQSVNVYQDVVFLGKGRSEIYASFSNTGRPFDPALEPRLVARLGVRLEVA